MVTGVHAGCVCALQLLEESSLMARLEKERDILSETVKFYSANLALKSLRLDDSSSRGGETTNDDVVTQPSGEVGFFLVPWSETPPLSPSIVFCRSLVANTAFKSLHSL